MTQKIFYIFYKRTTTTAHDFHGNYTDILSIAITVRH